MNSDVNTTTNASNGFSPNVLAYISLAFGFSLMVNVWIFFRVSGGLFNPVSEPHPGISIQMDGLLTWHRR